MKQLTYFILKGINFIPLVVVFVLFASAQTVKAQDSFMGYDYVTMTYPLAWTTAQTTFNVGTAREIIYTMSGGGLFTATVCGTSNINGYQLNANLAFIEMQLTANSTTSTITQISFTGSTNNNTNAGDAGVVFSDQYPFNDTSVISATAITFPSATGSWIVLNPAIPVGAKSMRIYRRIFYNPSTLTISTSAGTGFIQYGTGTTIRLASLAVTLAVSGTPPTVTTTAVSDITQTSASSGGNVTSEGTSPVTVRGVCWSTSQNPTTADSKTEDGSGPGSFTSSLTGLSTGTTYYVRAYATNLFGTSYGNQETFATLAGVASIVLSSDNPAVPVGNITTGSLKNPVYKFNLTVTVANTQLNQVDFSTAGTYTSLDISRLQLWFNTADNFGSAVQIGSDITSNLGGVTNLSFGSLTQNITGGETGYLWITADVFSNATTGRNLSIDAVNTAGLTFSSGNKSGSAFAGGLQTIIAAGNPGVYFRTKASGNWNATSTWETSDDSVAWTDAAVTPTNISNYIHVRTPHTVTVTDTVSVDQVIVDQGATIILNGTPVVFTILDGPGAIDMLVNGLVKATGTANPSPGPHTVNADGVLRFGNTGVYEHNQNAGAIPVSDWGDGSTCLITGVVGNSPGNANQDYHHFTWDCTGQTANLNLAWSGITISGNVTCLNSGASTRLQLTNNTAFVDSITIVGNVIVQNGTLTSNGSSGAQNYLIIVEGDVLVTGGNFSLSRGSGGVATWRLFGDLNVSNAVLQTSNTSSKFVFAGAAPDTQDIAMTTVTHTSSWDYEINSGAVVRIVNGTDSIDLVVKKNFINAGNIVAEGWVEFQNGSNYQHTVNSSTIPNGIWNTGSICTLTGITTQAPANRNQSYYNLVFNCPAQTANLNMGFDGVTIGGDISIVNTGTGRWYLAAPPAGDTATITINGDIIQSAGQFSSNGSSNAAFIEIVVNGDILVTGGNFSVSRGSQGGTGTAKWYLHGTNFSMSNATTQNSNAAGARLIFSGTTQQNMLFANVTYAGGGIPVEIASNAIVFAGVSEISGSGLFTVNSAATLACGHEGGLDSLLQNTGTKTLSTLANYTFNGTVVQFTGNLLPATVNNLTINNSTGVTLSSGVTVNSSLTLSNGDLHLNGNTITLGSTATLSESIGNTVTGLTGKILTIRDINAPSGLNIGGLGAMLTTSVNLGSTIIERYHYAAVQGSNTGILRVFNIQPANNTGLNATLRFYYDESELNTLPETNLVLFKSPGGVNNTWVAQGGTVNTVDNYVELSSINDLSFWTLAENVASTFQLSVDVINSWNMVAVPGINTDGMGVNTWWAFRDLGANVFRFTGSYTQVLITDPGEGYWMKHNGPRTYNTGDEWPAGGIQIVAHDPVGASLGWNLVGGYDVSVPVGSVTTTPPGLINATIFGYNGTYTAATHIVPGYAYWIKLSAAGTINIGGPLGKEGAQYVQTVKEDWGKIIITDASGKTFTLYASEGQVDLNYFEMPPLPPAGSFDVRFSSNRMAEDLSSNVQTIDMTSVEYPVTVTVENMSIRLMDETGKQLNENVEDGKQITINDSRISKLKVSGQLIPTVYALEQNFPNPFNPSTTIEFSLPEDVNSVKLTIYNALGERVAELVNSSLTAGRYSYQWNAGDVATGMYIYELRTDNFVSIKKMVLLK